MREAPLAVDHGAPGARSEPSRSPLWAWHPPRQQRAFRVLMNAFAYPGRVLPLADPGENAQALLLATLLDGATTLADASATLRDDDWRRLGAQRASTETAAFVLTSGCTPLGTTPALGSLENPEHGATLIVQADALGEGGALRLRGPGIPGQTSLQVRGIDPRWWSDRAQWNAGFPLGVDMVVVAGAHVVALPRTTRIEMEGVH